MFVSEYDETRVRRVDMTSGQVSTLAGDGTSGFKDGPGGEARFELPTSVTSDGRRTLFVADKENNCIRAIDVETGVVSTYAGSCGVIADYPDDDGTRAVARFPRPNSVTWHRGVLYVTDLSGVRVISGDVVTHIPSTNWQTVSHPGQIAFRGCEMIIAEFEGHRVLRVSE
jgi:hypothetical protein